jgi:hypothetical protein
MTDPEEIIFNFLDSKGLFNQWADRFSNTQNSPIVQLRWFDENKLNDSDMCLLIRNVSPGGGSRFAQVTQYIMAVFGAVGQSNVIARDYMNLIMLAMQKFTHSEQIIAIDPIGGTGGPYKTEKGRFTYDINYTVKIDTQLV